MVNELNSSGAVRLETLDGEQMANFINGSRLRRYHEPLTQEMMDRMQAAKTRKARADLLKKQAQEEAIARAKAIRARKHKVHILALKTIDIDDELPIVKPFRIATKLVTQKIDVGVNALIDSRADLNILSWDVWRTMGSPKLTPTLINFVGFSANETACLGKILLKLSIQDVPQYVLFYVANVDEYIEQIILGRHWMQTTNCHLDWITRTYTLQVNSRSITGICEAGQLLAIQPISKSTQSSPKIPIEFTILTSIDGHQRKEWVVPDSLLQAQGYGKGQKTFWVPKKMCSINPTSNRQEYKPRTGVSRPPRKKQRPQTSNNKRWG